MPALLALLAATATVPLAPTGEWKLDVTRETCRATRRFGPNGDTLLRLVALPLAGEVMLTVDTAGPTKAAYDDQVTLTLAPDHRVTTARTIGIAPADPAPHTIGLAVPKALLAGSASAAQLSVKGRTIADLTNGELAPVLGSLAACTDAALRSYGIDPASQAAVAIPPEAIGGGVSWFASDSYPQAALRAGAEGRVVAKVLVAADGGVADCVPVVSAGNADLDDRTCALIRTRARYRPARDRQGRTIPALQLVATRWTLPR